MQSYDGNCRWRHEIGLALACGLHGCGLRIAVIEKQARIPVLIRRRRLLSGPAINSASERLLGRLGCLAGYSGKRAAPYQA